MRPARHIGEGASGFTLSQRADERQRKDLEKQLHGSQNGNCFICGKPIDLTLHANAIDVDHVEPLKTGGKDDPKNFAPTHSSCNRSKQASNLRIARVLAQFETNPKRGFGRKPGSESKRRPDKVWRRKHELCMKVEHTTVKYSLPEIGSNEVHSVPLYKDQLSG